MKGISVNLLMTGGGAPGAAGILQCLKEMEGLHITVADSNPELAQRYQDTGFETVPMGTNPSFPDVIQSICRRKKIDIILPLVTRELLPLSSIRKELEGSGTHLPITGAGSLEIANNKSRLYEFLQWRGIPVPEFRVVETSDQFVTAVNELGYPGNPVCFKPSVSNGSRGFRILSENADERDLLFNFKPYHTYIRYDEAVRILSSAAFPELLVSEYLPGEEYSVDCLCKNGEPVLIVPRLRKKMINGISTEGEVQQQHQVIDYCARIIRELKLHGNAGIQVKRAASGEILLLEINPRVQGTISALLGAGINLPVLAVKQELNIPISTDETKVRWGTRFTRVWSEIFY